MPGAAEAARGSEPESFRTASAPAFLMTKYIPAELHQPSTYSGDSLPRVCTQGQRISEYGRSSGLTRAYVRTQAIKKAEFPHMSA